MRFETASDQPSVGHREVSVPLTNAHQVQRQQAGPPFQGHLQGCVGKS